MGFNLYFASNGGEDWKRQHNCNQLLSQINDKKRLLDWVDYLRKNPSCKSKLFVDSGAYSVWTKNKVLDVDKYIELLNDIDDVIECFAQCDTIPGAHGRTPTPEEIRTAPDKSWNNFLYMVDKVKSPKKLIPIFHQFEPWSVLERMINYKYPDGSYIDYIGLSPQEHGVSKESWVEFFDKCFKIIHSSNNPNVKTHAFGCTVTSILESFPFYSADSATAVLAATYGNIVLNGKYISFSGRENQQINSDHFIQRSSAVQESIRSEVHRLGFDVDYLLDNDDYEYRTTINVASMWDWAINYKCCFTNHKKQINKLW